MPVTITSPTKSSAIASPVKENVLHDTDTAIIKTNETEAVTPTSTVNKTLAFDENGEAISYVGAIKCAISDGSSDILRSISMDYCIGRIFTTAGPVYILKRVFTCGKDKKRALQTEELVVN